MNPIINEIRRLPGGVRHYVVLAGDPPEDITARAARVTGRRVHGGVIVTHYSPDEIRDEIREAMRRISIDR